MEILFLYNSDLRDLVHDDRDHHGDHLAHGGGHRDRDGVLRHVLHHHNFGAKMIRLEVELKIIAFLYFLNCPKIGPKLARKLVPNCPKIGRKLSGKTIFQTVEIYQTNILLSENQKFYLIK